ncbi:MAG: non-canonical purine NTP pyrophosphatase [Candidatus Wallbacteria bacterium]
MKTDILNLTDYFKIVDRNKELFVSGAIKPRPAVPIFLYTGNKDKISEFNHYFAGTSFYFLGLEDLRPDIKNAAKAGEPPEDGDTLLANSKIKSSYGFKIAKIAVVADDTGFFVDALNGEPGIRAGRYATSTGHDYEANRQLLLKNLMQVEDKARTAYFQCMITLRWPGINDAFEFLGEVRGAVLHEKRGGNQFGYDPVFAPKGYSEAFSEMPLELKNKISHRGLAFKLLHDFLENKVKTQ